MGRMVDTKQLQAARPTQPPERQELCGALVLGRKGRKSDSWRMVGSTRKSVLETLSQVSVPERLWPTECTNPKH